MFYPMLTFAAAALAHSGLAAPATTRLRADEEALVYKVRQGDTFYTLARDYLVDMRQAAALQKLARVSNARRLPVGRDLAIPRDMLRFDPIVMRVQTFSGPVTLAGGTPTRGAVVGEGVELATGANGFVTLIGDDGSRVTLPSNSRVRLERARRYRIDKSGDIEFSVQGGKADVSAAKQLPQGRFRVRTPVAVAAVRGTSYRVGTDEDAAVSRTEVIEGLVGVAASGEAVDVGAGQGVVARPGEALAPEQLLPPALPIDPGKVQTEELVHFTFKPVAGASGYHSQVANDASFLDIVAEGNSTLPEADFADIPNGNRFVRSAPVSASGLEGLSEAFAFRRQRVGLAASAEPSDLPDSYRFNWLVTGEGTSLFRFQLFMEGQEEAVVDEPGLDKAGLTLTALRPGTYRWRVGVIQTVPEGSAEVWTPPQKLNVSN